MLKAKERQVCLYSFVKQYVEEQQKNRGNNREVSSAYTFSKGKLAGFCAAYRYEIVETIESVRIVSKGGRVLVSMNWENINERN